jgi:hypothetical protein
LIAAKDMGIDKLSVFGDSKLIIHQIKKIYQTKKQRLKQYRNEVWDYVDNFFLAFNITFVHRNLNQQVDTLAIAVVIIIPIFRPRSEFQRFSENPHRYGSVIVWRIKSYMAACRQI